MIIGKKPSQSSEIKNRSIRDIVAFSLLFDQVKRPPSNGRSLNLQDEIKSENACIDDVKWNAPNLSEGNLIALKSPPTTHGTPHQVTTPAISSHIVTLSLLILGP
jgi:hypothetical protein